MSLRIVIPGLPHHVLARSNNQRRLFSFPADYKQMIGFIGQSVEKHECQVHALALMKNHLHMIVTPLDEKALPKFVAAFSQRYASARNRSKGASGRLWQQRYECLPLLELRDLGIAILHADTNALRDGVVTDGAGYRWSTFALHAGEPERADMPASMWTPSAWYLSLGATKEARAARYRELAEEHVEQRVAPRRAERIEAIEAASRVTGDIRLRRPDGTRAAEPRVPWGRGGSGRLPPGTL